MLFSARLWSTIRWTPRPRDGRIAIASDAHHAATSPAKEKFCGNIVLHGRKKRIRWAYKAGRFNAIALPPQFYNQSPITHGPSNCQPPSSPRGAPLGIHVDSRGPCHASAPPSRHLGVAWPSRLCHVALWPCRICAGPMRHVSIAHHVSPAVLR